MHHALALSAITGSVAARETQLWPAVKTPVAREYFEDGKDKKLGLNASHAFTQL